MRKLLKYLPFILCASVLLFAVSGSLDSNVSGNLRKQSPKIIYIYKTTSGDIEFWRSMTQGIKAGAEEFGFDYTILGATEETDIEGNITAMQRAISLSPDAIVLSAADYELLEPAAGKAAEADILLLTIDSDVAGGVSRCFIGTDNYELGRRQGEELLKRISGGGQVGIVGHVRNSLTAIERVRGITDALEDAGIRAVIPPVYCDNQILKAREQALALLDEYADIEGFVATNERAAIGLAEAIYERGAQDRISVVTCDHASRQISYLESGVIDATVVQKPFNMGYFSVQIANSLLKNKNASSIPEFFNTGSNVITKENYLTPENQKLLFPFWAD